MHGRTIKKNEHEVRDQTFSTEERRIPGGDGEKTDRRKQKQYHYGMRRQKRKVKESAPPGKRSIN